MELEKRKQVRVEHKSNVEFVNGDLTFQGTTINISRNGLQVVVSQPVSHDSIRSIVFQLPDSGTKISIPCRLVRTSGNGQGAEHVLGIEFQYEAEAQLLLIEKYMQDAISRTAEARQLPRTACRLRNVKIDRRGVQVLSIDNLSTEGCLISFRGALRPGDIIGLQLIPYDCSHRLRLPGEVVYVLEKDFREESAAGIRFHGFRKTEETRLRNLILACCSGSAVSEMHQLFHERLTASEHRIAGEREIAGLLGELAAERAALSLLVDGSLHIEEAVIDNIQQEEGLFTVPLPAGGGLAELSIHSEAAPCPAYLAFYWKGSSHYFKTIIAYSTANSLRLRFPAAIFRSDKRSYKRKGLELSAIVRLIPEDAEGGGAFEGVLLDISRRGFLCEIPLESGLESAIAEGRSVRYVLDQRLGLGAEGQVRHIQRVNSKQGQALQIGIEAGIARRDYQATVIQPEDWGVEQLEPEPSGKNIVARLESIPVSFRTKTGQIIRGLLNITHRGARTLIVIIPPSYGKKKEAFAPLAATLIANAWSQGKQLAVLRYDGVNRPGESHNDVENPRMGYEMLSYRISQGLADLQAALEFVRHNEHFVADRKVLITFSMSSIDARRLLAQNPKHGIDFWINCMGVPCAQTTLRNVLAGIDIVSNARMGISNGLMGMLGHLINMDVLAQDVLDRKYAFLTDARFDMARISVPVLWICGQYDKWVDQAEVRDLMSVRAAAAREVLGIPSGHNLRTSDDAIHTYKLMASAIHREFYGQVIEACDPDKAEMLRLITAERERLENRCSLPSMPDYWRGYLIGNEKNKAGYDFYRNVEEFVGFFQAEVELLRLNEREIIADLGCGTGLFLEALLLHLARHRMPPVEYEIEAFDLVPEALAKAESKCRALLESASSLGGVKASFLQADLEPNRLIPVARFLEPAGCGLEGLRDKIGGFTSAVLDRLLELSCPEVRELLGGAKPTRELVQRASIHLRDRELATVLDFNLAARFLRKRLSPVDLKKQRGAGKPSGKSLRASDLSFRILDFGTSSRRLESPFTQRRYTAIVASLFVSYLFNPEYLVEDCYKALQPGGQLLVSSMKPDSDLSMIFVNYIQALQRAEWNQAHERDREQNLSEARAMLNEAAALFELEESGFFRFYTAHQLYDLLSHAGFQQVSVRPSMGSPPQAFIAIGFKP
jgi:SAM-dependent methyltransferase/pimeloyl-ACP methyl ester carboxylesterase